MAEAMTAEDEKWQAESDAHTLAEAEAIQADEGRMKKASAAAKEMLKEQEERAKAMKRVALLYDKSPKPPKDE